MNKHPKTKTGSCGVLLLLWLATGAVGLLEGAAASQAQSTVVAQVREYRQANEPAILGAVVDLVSIPNFAEDENDIRRNAEYLLAQLRARGVRAMLLESPGSPPAVLGTLPATNDPSTKKTIVLYAHYDGQPVAAKQWTSAPYTAELREGLDPKARVIDLAAVQAGDLAIDPEWRLFGRSASDDKAPIVAMLAAVDALAASKIDRSVNVKFFFEGEEERGSPHSVPRCSRLTRTCWTRTYGSSVMGLFTNRGSNRWCLVCAE